MSHPSHPRRLRALAGLSAGLVTVSLLAAGAGAVPDPDPAPTAGADAAAPTGGGAGRYIVILGHDPAAAYSGGVQGYRATAAAEGDQYDSSTAAAADYTRYLRRQQTTLAASVGAEPYYHYTTALDGFAARLTARQATALSKKPQVLGVVRDRMRTITTDYSPAFLGLTGAAGVWRRLGGTDPASGAGDDVIVGIIDSGVDPEAPSLQPTPGGSDVPDDWNGICDAGADDTFSCNDKLIGGRYFAAGAVVVEGEKESPADIHGHGTHVGTTAAGNYGVDATIDGTNYGPTSGMAPGAKVASYKVCWQNPDGANCGAATSDSVAAIDAATRDGVDVVNYSISGTSDNVIDPVELAFMYAADAGVFVAASAGNSGPGASTVAHPSPWLTTVAAATHHNREATLVLGDGTRMVGASSAADGVESSPLTYAGDHPADGAEAAEAALCLPDTLDSAAVTGAIVICDRGNNARAEKGQVVADAGGVGMVLVNPTENSVNADIQAVPTVHLGHEKRADLLAYKDTADPTAEILAGQSTGSDQPVPPAIAGFSSRGPSLAADGDLLKPDIAAPGVDVLANVPATEQYGGNQFTLMSGTSMSSPHIAGLAALVIDKHPAWSPMAVKSAMMTTARNLTDTADPFDMGAGFVRPRQFLEPGLVFESDWNDWASYLAGQGVTYADGTPFSSTPLAASNLNTPSVAINDLAGKETVTRYVTNRTSRPETYRVRTTRLAAAGVKATVSPSTFDIAPGQTRRVTINVERTTAPFGSYAKGFVQFLGETHAARIPLVARPVAVAAPAQVKAPVNGTFTLRTRSGYTGTMSQSVRGLVAAGNHEVQAENTGGAAFDPADPRNYRTEFVIQGPLQGMALETVPEFDDTDLDMYVLDAQGNLVATAATGTGNEKVQLHGLPNGTYSVYVQAWSVHDDQEVADLTLRRWKVSGTPGNLTVKPGQQAVRTGTSTAWQGTTSRLDRATSYRALVHWRRVTGSGRPVVASTWVSVN